MIKVVTGVRLVLVTRGKEWNEILLIEAQAEGQVTEKKPREAEGGVGPLEEYLR